MGLQDDGNDNEEDSEVAELLEKKERLLQTLQDKKVRAIQRGHSLFHAYAWPAVNLLYQKYNPMQRARTRVQLMNSLHAINVNLVSPMKHA